MTGAIIPLIGWTLIHFLWQGALIAAGSALLLWALRHASPQARYVTACAALFLMLAAPLMTARLLGTRPAPVGPAEFRASEVRIVLLRHDRAAVAPKSAIPVPDMALSQPIEPVLRLLVVFWLGGILLLGLRLGGGLWRARRLRRAALACPISPWDDMSRVVAARLGIVRPVTVVDSSIVDTPTMIGWVSPLIVLPAAALAGLSPAQVEAIVAHELAHVRRHDYLVNLLQAIAETLLFYHPGVWWVSRRIRIEREHCCDDMAVAVSGDPIGYAAALAELEAARSNQGFALAATGGSLLARVRRVLAPERRDPRSPLGIAAAAVLAIVLVACGAAVQRLAAAPGDHRVIGAVQQVERVRLRWERSSTDNIDLLTTPELAVRGERVRQWAQEAYVRLATDLRHELESRPTIALVGSDAALRRLLDARLLPNIAGNLIVMPADRSDDELAVLLRHELTQAFLSAVIGPVAVPAWITEGLAAHQGGLWTALERSRVLRLIGSNTLPSVESLTRAPESAEAAGAVGHAAFDFIASRWDKDGIRAFLTALHASDGDVPRSIELAFAITPAQFDRAFGDYVRTAVASVPLPPPQRASDRDRVRAAAGGASLLDFRADRTTATNATARELIRLAYGLRGDQLTGGPRWLDTERFDVTTSGDGDGAHAGPAALRRLLAERFALRLAEGTVNVPVYELRATPDLGPSLHRSSTDCHGDALERPQQGACGMRWQGIGRAEGRGITMNQLAATLSHAGPFDHPVVDRTGLLGAFDFDLRFSPYARRADAPLHRLARALEWASLTDPLPEALRAQLGLEVVEATAPSNVFVIEHVEYPERN